VEKALADFEKAIKLNPKLADPYYHRGLIKKKKVDLDGAMADFNRAVELNPRLAEALSSRGGIHKKQGDLPWAPYGNSTNFGPLLSGIACEY
jgi:tetratricopeptide (TPR) repeat protein